VRLGSVGMRRRGGGGHGRKPWRGRGACARGGVRRVAKRARRCWCVRPPCWRRPRLCQRRQSPAVAPRGVGAAAPQRHGRHTGEGGGRARSRRATRWPTPSACHAPEPRPMGATHARCLPAPPPPLPAATAVVRSRSCDGRLPHWAQDHGRRLVRRARPSGPHASWLPHVVLPALTTWKRRSFRKRS